ncbi:unnamed protein product [Phytomonas sp. Hart1]|nr:unnamed protein product [Phytomonas sp. Hart1]|eukprot:CCW70588.1 unnamed protein product [Phytomonas sp. isolate Hart1]
MSNFQTGCNSILKRSSQNPFLSTLDRSQVLASLKDENPVLNPSRVEEKDDRSLCLSNLTMMEPSLKHPRLESSAGALSSKKSSEGENLFPRVCEGSSSEVADAVYFESLLGQLVGVDLFLRFSDMESEGNAFLEGMQRKQEELFRLKKHIEELNALRYVEQKDFAERMKNVQGQITKLSAKKAALDKILGSSTKKNLHQKVVRQSPNSILRLLDE